MLDSIVINNYSDALFCSTITNNTYCEHRLPGHGLMFVRSGSMTIETKDECIEARAGSYIFWKRDCSARMYKRSDGGTPYRSIAIALTRKFLKEYFSSTMTNNKLPVRVAPLEPVATLLPDTIALESLFQSLIPYADRNVAPTEDMIRLKLQEAVRCLLAIDSMFYPTLFDFHETWKIDLLEFMEHHFTEDMSLDEFASYTGRSLATFKRDFAKISSITPQRWIIEHRLELAKRLINEDGVRVSDVYAEVGFKNRSHFSSAFKLRFGCAPSECRQSNNN